MPVDEADREQSQSITLGHPIVRDYLYVDLRRVRSLLSQVAGGAPETVQTTMKGSWDAYARLNLRLFGAGIERGSEEGTTETNSMTDMHFALLEESAEALGLLTDVTELSRESSNWHGARVQSEILEGQLIRVSGPISLVDSTYVQDSLTRFEEMIDGWTTVSEGQSEDSTPSKSGPAPTKRTGSNSMSSQALAKREQQRQEAARKVTGGTDLRVITGMKTIMSSLLQGDGITIRAMPSGSENPDCSFVGTLLNRSEYIESERGAIFSRLGLKPTEWTVVGIVSRFATAPTTSLTTPQGEFDRTKLEELTVSLLDLMEGLGLTSAPRWPGVAITPLAVYRVLP